MGEPVEIVEVGPRDGLQNEPRIVPVAQKIALVDLLGRAGFRRIEAASFVSPRWVPQMADGAVVMAGITRQPGVRYSALTPNLKGYEAARAAGVDEVAVFASAAEGFSRANLNASIAESLERFRPVCAAAAAEGVPVRGYVSCVTDCPVDGPTRPEAVVRVASALLEMGCFEISLGDTLGRAIPARVAQLLAALEGVLPVDRIAGHFHDTSGRALENIEVALEHGVRVFDASVGGLGGCPYAPGAAGNVATEAVATRLTALGFEHGLDMELLTRAAALARSLRSA